MHPTKQELIKVLQLTPFARYEYFIKKVADFEEVYTLVDQDGNWALLDVDDKECASLWPAQEFAELNAVEGWGDYQILSLPLETFMREFLQLAQQKKQLFNIFSANNKTGFVVSPEELLRDLEQELTHYE